MMSLLLNLVGGTFKDWLSYTTELAKQKQIARSKVMNDGISGYSDEFLVLVWSYPVIASFIPDLQYSVAQGFSFLETMPEWYIGGFMSISFAVFGIDKLFRFKGSGNGK